MFVCVYTHMHIYVCMEWKERKMTQWLLRQAFSRFKLFQDYTTLDLRPYQKHVKRTMWQVTIKI